MTPDQARLLLPVIQAYAEGKTVEQLCGGRWYACSDPDFGYPASHYRVAPDLVRVKGWLNVYSGTLTVLYPTKGEADNYADSDRIACIEIDVEGERLG